MQKSWSSAADFNTQATFVDTRLSGDSVTLVSGETEGTCRIRFEPDEGIVKFTSLTWDDSWLDGISKVKVRVRTGDTVILSYDDFAFDETDDTVQWTSFFVDSPTSLIDLEGVRDSQYIELEIALESNNLELSVPSIGNIVLNYELDTSIPEATTNLRVGISGRSINTIIDR